jgi:ankyrin repeat protein
MFAMRQTLATAIVLLFSLSTPVNGSDALLADAAEQQNTKLVQSLITKSVDVNISQVDGMTALHWSVYHDDLAMTDQLIKAKANPSLPNRYGVLPLSLACTNGNLKIVSILLEAGADANTSQNGNETALMTAARTGKPEVVKLLIGKGAKVDVKERKGQTALMWAASQGNVEVVKLLLEAGADFKTTLPSGYTPLFFAVREGRIEVVRVLLKAGADVNTPIEPKRGGGGKAPSPGMSPLVLAIENGHFELAAALLELGADPNDQRSGFTPLHMLTWVRKPNRGDGDDGDPAPIGSGNLTSLQMAEKLVKHGADVNQKLKRGASGRAVLGRRGATPFLLACLTDDVPLMKTLIKLGADPRLKNSEGSTPLMAAAGLGTLAPEEQAGTEAEALEAVALAFEVGNDINAVDANGETAMHGAAYKSLPRVVEWLANKGAKIEVWNTKNKHGWTPLSIAQGYRPGNFKPSAETVEAILKVMKAAGVSPPSKPFKPEDRKGYAEPKAVNPLN